MHLHHDHVGGDHSHSHEHTHTHEHTHDGVAHTHAHEHCHEHGHQHPHEHEHLHGEGHTHDHSHECGSECGSCCSGCSHTPMEELTALMKSVEDQMLSAAKALDFEKAAKLRDELFQLKGESKEQIIHKPQRMRHRRKKM